MNRKIAYGSFYRLDHPTECLANIYPIPTPIHLLAEAMEKADPDGKKAHKLAEKYYFISYKECKNMWE